MSTRRNKKGFLLLEVVASIAIVAIGLAVILRSFSSSLRASRIAQEYFEASLLLQEKLSQLEAEEKLEGGVEKSETVDNLADTPFEIKTKITGMNDLDPLDEVRAVIQWQAGQRNEGFEISTYLNKR